MMVEEIIGKGLLTNFECYVTFAHVLDYDLWIGGAYSDESGAPL